jgi:hypothetical protein
MPVPSEVIVLHKNDSCAIVWEPANAGIFGFVNQILSIRARFAIYSRLQFARCLRSAACVQGPFYGLFGGRSFSNLLVDFGKFYICA